MDIKLEILQASYWEHFKAAKDLALIYPPENEKIKRLTKTINELSEQINFLKANIGL